MDRTQAVSLIKEISEQCNFLEGKSIMLLPPQDNYALSNTFQVRIQVSNYSDPILVSCIETISEKHNLATKEIDGYLIVYKPYPKKREIFSKNRNVLSAERKF